MMAKKHTAAENEVRMCDFEGCAKEGTFPAPRSRKPNDYYWFCEDHVRQYNKEWNYFKDCNEGFISTYLRAAMVGMRPTWTFGTNRAATHPHIHGMGFSFGKNQRKSAAPYLPQKTRDALDLLSLPHAYSLSQLKTQYRNMVKKTHPDLCGNTKENAKKMRAITDAYHHLMQHHKNQ